MTHARAFGLRLGLLAVAHAWGCTTDPAGLDGPTQAVVGPDQRLYVSDGYYNARVAVFSLTGELLAEWGSKGFGQAQLNTPHALAVDADGTVIVADRDNGRIQRFTSDGDWLSTWQGELIGRPWSLTLLPDGGLAVADGGDQRPAAARAGIALLGPDGAFRDRFGGFGAGPGELDEPHMIAASSTRALYVAELGNDRVQRYEARCQGANCVYEVVSGWPELPASPALEPLSLAVGGGRVYVGRQGEGAPVWVFDELTGMKVAELGAGLVDRPHGLSLDGEQRLWITDDRGDRVVRLSLEGEVLLTIGASR